MKLGYEKIHYYTVYETQILSNELSNTSSMVSGSGVVRPKRPSGVVPPDRMSGITYNKITFPLAASAFSSLAGVVLHGQAPAQWDSTSEEAISEVEEEEDVI